MDLWNFWDRYTHASETRVWLEKAVAQPGLGVSPIRIQALRMANYLALRQVDYPGAKAWAERSLAMAEETGDRWEITRSLNHLAITALLQGDYDSGRSLLEACLAGYRELRREEYIPGILNNLGELARYQGDFEHAVALYEETLAHFKASGERIGTMVTMESLGYAQYHLGLFHEARATLFEALTLARDTDSLMHVAVILASLGGVIIARLDRTGGEEPWAVEQAVHLFGVSTKLLESIGKELEALDQAEFERNVAAARALLGDAAFTAAWEVGRAMSIDQALQGATQDGKQGREETRQRGQGGLTSREYEVANFVTRGLTNEEIARTLVLSERTVEMHVSNAMHKLGLTKRTQLAAWAVEHGLAAGSNRS